MNIDINTVNQSARIPDLQTDRPLTSRTVKELKPDTYSASEDQVRAKVYTKYEIAKEVGHLNDWMQARATHLSFKLHEKTHEYYVQIINDQTNAVIREVPSKKVMDMVADMQKMIGLLIDEKA